MFPTILRLPDIFAIVAVKKVCFDMHFLIDVEVGGYSLAKAHD